MSLIQTRMIRVFEELGEKLLSLDFVELPYAPALDRLLQ